MKLKLLLLFLLIQSICLANNPFKGLPFYKTIGTGGVYYNSKKAVVIKKKFKEHENFIKVKINRRYIYISMNSGPSEDLTYELSVKKNKKMKSIGVIGAESLYIPGNNYIYARGRNNNWHTMYKKYRIKAGKIKEVKQKYYYVGLKTKTLSDIKLYSNEKLDKEIARIKKGSNIEVVISNGDTKFLVKTPFGLLGWYDVRNDNYMRTPLEGITFHGD